MKLLQLESVVLAHEAVHNSFDFVVLALFFDATKFFRFDLLLAICYCIFPPLNAVL
jgi:hypothetical protein